MEENKATRILIVEDDKILGFDLKLSLESMNYKVIGPATNYEDAVRFAVNEEPDVALMDIQIKGVKTGIDAAKTLRENLDIPVIYLTSTIEEQVMMRAIETEPAGYLLKPFRKEEIRNNIEIAYLTHVKTRQLKADLQKFSSVMKSLNDAVIILDKEQKISFVNNAAEVLLKRLSLEMIGNDPNDYFVVEGEMNFQDSLDSLPKVREEKSIDIASPTYIKNKDGEQLAITASISSFFEKEGTLEGYFISFEEYVKKILEENTQPNKESNTSNTSDFSEKKQLSSNSWLMDGYVFIKDRGKLNRVFINDIRWVEALGDYVNIHTADKKFTTLMTMKKLEAMLPQKSFCRVHRSHIINLDKISSINSNDYDVIIGDKRIPIGETYKSELMKRINVL